MAEFFNHLIYPLPNAVMTVIMGVLVLYWLFVLIGGVGLDDLDLGFDFDVDIPEAGDLAVVSDGDVDMAEASEIDGEVAVEKEPGFFVKFLNFLNVGKVPFMLIFSTLKFFTWLGSLITTQFIDVSSWGAWSLLILLPLLFISIFLTKGATTPMAKFFKAIGYRGEDEIDFLGRSGKMLSTIKDDKVGCAEVVVEKNPIRLNVRSIDGVEIKYGDSILIADQSDDKRTYLVSKDINLDNF